MPHPPSTCKYMGKYFKEVKFYKNLVAHTKKVWYEFFQCNECMHQYHRTVNPHRGKPAPKCKGK